MTLAIRRAGAADAPALHRLIEGAYRGDGAGEVVLKYASLEQLDDICRRLMQA